MKKQRKHYTPEEKVAILRRHLVEGVPISDLCDELGLHLERNIRTKDQVLAELMAEHVALKKELGNSDRVWVPHDTQGWRRREWRKNRRQRAA
jgi:transposase-like protein